MKTLRENRWQRRGISLLWDNTALAGLAVPTEVHSIRQFVALAGRWPDDLPSNAGNALVVGGLDGCLDLLKPTDAEQWLENDLRNSILSFQGHYNSDAALVFWLPMGRGRVRMNRASETYFWVCAAPFGGQRLDLGRILWAGAEADVARILDPANTNVDSDGPAWIGLYHPRLS